MFIVSMIALVISVIAGVLWFFAFRKNTSPDGRLMAMIAKVTAIATFAIAVIAGLSASIYRQSPGEASVITNLSGTIAHENYSPGFAFKMPWQGRVEFDLFSQQLTYAGSNGEAPAYTDGNVQGNEVSAPVAGGVMSNFDISITYNLQGEKVAEIYERYKSQENFTNQVVVQRSLAVLRTIPSTYSPAEFNGVKRGEAQSRMETELRNNLKAFGVDVQTVSLQAVRFDKAIEDSLIAVSTAQQKEAEAQANLRATEVEAQAKVVQAQAEADANRVINESLTDRVLQKAWIDAIRESGNTVVVPDNVAPMINIGKGE